MTAKTSTFAGQLKHFAQSVDIVDDGTFDQVRELVYLYVTNELHGEYFELLKERSTGDGDRQSWLQTFWSSDEKLHLWPVRGSDGGYTNPVTAAYDTDRPICLVNSDKKPLKVVDDYVDMWSETEGLTRYRPESVGPTRTVIIVPLSFRRPLGAYCIESSEYIEITDVAKLELRRLADALAILYGAWDANNAHLAGKEHAISDLRELLRRARFPKLAKPHVFVAFSHAADETVKLVIKDVLADFGDRLEFTDWAQIDETGNINAQITREILESRFGICYFSEPAPPGAAGGKRYDDNRNVVFEAGMLHARTNATADAEDGEPTGWIPVREEDSPPPPFDFAAERILYVPRARSGELNESRLREMLTRRIALLLRDA